MASREGNTSMVTTHGGIFITDKPHCNYTRNPKATNNYEPDKIQRALNTL